MEGVPLLNATIKGDLETVVLLLDTGVATVDTHNPRRETPLYWACARGDLDLSRVLTLRGATIDFRSLVGLTPLHAAADRGHHQCVQFLLQNGADPDARTAEGRTPLHLAAYRGNTAVTRILLRQGARHDITDADGKTPVDVSACQGHWDDVRIFLNHRGNCTVHRSSHHRDSHPDTAAPSGGQKGNLSRERSISADRSRRHKTPILEDIGRRSSDDQIQLRSRRDLQVESSVISHGGNQKVKPPIGECKWRGRQTIPSLGDVSGASDQTPKMILDSISFNLQAQLDGGTEQTKHMNGECMTGQDVNEQSTLHVISGLLQGVQQLGRYSERLEKEVKEWKEKALSLEQENDALRQTLTEMLLSPSSGIS